MFLRSGVAGIVFGVLLPAAASAHHSPAMFDAEKIHPLTGTVREFQWHNPHCYIQWISQDGKGKSVEWSLEMGAPMYLYNKGWRPSTLKPGDQVTAMIAPLRSGKPGGLVVDILTPDGHKLKSVKP